MKKFFTTTLMIAMFSTLAFNQNLTQTVRGTIVDADSKLPLTGATLVIPGTDPGRYNNRHERCLQIRKHPFRQDSSKNIIPGL